MSSTAAPVNDRGSNAYDKSYENREGLDVDWLLHSKREFSAHTRDNARPKQDQQTEPLTPIKNTDVKDSTASTTQAVTTSAQNDIAKSSTTAVEAPKPTYNNGHSTTNNTQTSSPAQKTPPSQQPNSNVLTHNSRGHVGGLKKEGRKSSWISSLGHKLSGGSSPAKGADAQKVKSPINSPQAVEFGNPFERRASTTKAKAEERRDSSGSATDPPVMVPLSPRRPSVLVAAGTETKVESPGFLSSALRRLSSSNNVTLGKGAGSGALCPRKVMNVDHNRERTRISEFDQSKLKRVAFCVDVEIAGISASNDEEHVVPTDAVGHNLPTSNLNQSTEKSENKDVKSAKYKDMGEGAALKNPTSASQEVERMGKTSVDIVAEAKVAQIEEGATGSSPDEKKEGDVGNPPAPTTTRKKEKKKRSEAERKERKERKRKHAVANGLIPLELTRDDDDDSDSSPNSTPGTSTPRKNADQPTTDPLRIYKRCCQLRETTALTVVKDQITKPAAALAEAPGTVAIVDLSGAQMSLPDITTLGDWLAVVPVRKLVLDNCDLTDEAVRIILSGLASCKTSEQAKQNRKIRGKRGQEKLGVIEKLSLKNNSSITSLGWKHIALFIHLSRSLRGIDLSGIPYPKASDTVPRITVGGSGNAASTNGSGKSPSDMGKLITRAISERIGDKLEELIFSGCGLSASNVYHLINAAIKCRIRRLGLAGNNLDMESLEHVVRYITSGACEGLDLGSNNLHGIGHVISQVLDEKNPLFALSLADCELTPDDLEAVLPRFTKLGNFKFLDLSRNRKLFADEQNAISILRKVLPKMNALKRIHLVDSDLTPDHVIALSEIFPDCQSLAHVNILENQSLVQAMNAQSAELQEEAAAFLASLMTAVRVSNTIAAIEIEVPSADTNEVVRALSSQVVAYTLRNMERSTLSDMGVQSAHGADKDASDVLLHLVGHMDGYQENHDNDGPAPDEDYLIASTGIVKALGVCLRNKDGSRQPSRNITPTASGTATPRRDGQLRSTTRKQPKDVSRELCESARKIRMRLRPALIKEDRAGNNDAYQRLQIIDGTLERVIQRFEDEYPETKPSPKVNSSLSSSTPDVYSPFDSPDISRVTSRVDSDMQSPEDGLDHHDNEPYSLKLSRTPSNTSLAARALTSEEGRMHRFGQSMRRELLKPTGTDDYAHGTSINDAPEAPHLSALRLKLEALRGEEIRQRVNTIGADEVIKELGVNAEELRALKEDDPEGFAMFRDSHMAAQMNIAATSAEQGRTNGGLISQEEAANAKPNTTSAIYAQVTQ